ncbi:MAG: metal ABC transporter ATP-binding protein [Candidatus Omnitrophota bacterium]|nr:metal ABC transporter ATP-binding protein [Candidatus Omnitrophota bacterium]
MNVLEVKNLSVRYRDIEALSGVTFEIAAGDYVGVVGPNGSGKTTLIRALLGLMPFDGEITLLGRKIKDFSGWRHIGYLPQKMAFLDQRFPATALEIVVSGLYCRKKFPKTASRSDYIKAENTMELLKIGDLKDRPIGKLSGGQQQRVLLARALTHDPDVLMLDEPTVALDPRSREAFYLTVQALNKDRGVTVLLVSHDTGSVGKYASKLMYLDRSMVFYGSFEEFCKSENMADYFGTSAQHLICHRH